MADGAAVGRDRHRRHVVAGIAVVVGLVVSLVGAAVWSAPDPILLGSRWGSLVSALGGATMVVGGAMSLFALDTPGRSGAAPTAARSLVPDAAPLEDLS